MSNTPPGSSRGMSSSTGGAKTVGGGYGQQRSWQTPLDRSGS